MAKIDFNGCWFTENYAGSKDVLSKSVPSSAWNNSYNSAQATRLLRSLLWNIQQRMEGRKPKYLFTSVNILEEPAAEFSRNELFDFYLIPHCKIEEVESEINSFKCPIEVRQLIADCFLYQNKLDNRHVILYVPNEIKSIDYLKIQMVKNKWLRFSSQVIEPNTSFNNIVLDSINLDSSPKYLSSTSTIFLGDRFFVSKEDKNGTQHRFRIDSIDPLLLTINHCNEKGSNLTTDRYSKSSKSISFHNHLTKLSNAYIQGRVHLIK